MKNHANNFQHVGKKFLLYDQYCYELWRLCTQGRIGRINPRWADLIKKEIWQDYHSEDILMSKGMHHLTSQGAFHELQGHVPPAMIEFNSSEEFEMIRALWHSFSWSYRDLALWNDLPTHET